ncbi:SDR family oxidoreductase [Novipirellula artificiosorum]|uniref:Putative oxidoreductase UxuB n=1 Tax=Novipirellula artificiosorum TaxID=2528016 RepID=A0A5C6D7A3_9BACT|nr:SDR family oxidoreductase [Novipirellula artificiosorum]TWU31714.1 putative oxidoreductase UxuB [Novipirellula artificiosorum]
MKKINLFDITGRVMVVTGAAGVLAGGAARYLQSQGAFVVYLDLFQEKVDATLEDARKISDQCCGFACNVLDQQALDDVCKKVMATCGKVDVLINGAGGNMPGATVGPDQDVFDVKLEDYSKVLDLNLKGSVMPTMAFARIFKEQGHGCVLNFSSMSSPLALTRVLGYSNAKAAIDNFTRWMAAEMALKYGDKLRVNAIAPGFFISNQNRALLTNEDGSFTERGQQVINNTPFRRFGEAEEVFGTIHYLVSDAASFVTGTVAAVDGGFSTFSGV